MTHLRDPAAWPREFGQGRLDPARPLTGRERWVYPLICLLAFVAILAMLFFGSRS